MHWQDQRDTVEVFKQDIMDYFAKYSRNQEGYIVASCHSDFSDGNGDNPPHLKARRAYEKIVKAGRFICTHEYPTKKSPAPLVFTVDQNGFKLDEKRDAGPAASTLGIAVVAARGATQPPTVQTGFGAMK